MQPTAYQCSIHIPESCALVTSVSLVNFFNHLVFDIPHEGQKEKKELLEKNVEFGCTNTKEVLARLPKPRPNTAVRHRKVGQQEAGDTRSWLPTRWGSGGSVPDVGGAKTESKCEAVLPDRTWN